MTNIVRFQLFRLLLVLCWRLNGLCEDLTSNQDSSANERALDAPYFFYQQTVYPRDCAEARAQCLSSNRSGVYLIKPDGYPEPFEVYCENAIDSEGWTVIQRHYNSAIDFNRNWTEYKIGFGFLSGEFWLGNNKLSFLTNQNDYELRIDFTSAYNASFYVSYKRFRIGDEYSGYKLTGVGEYMGSEDSITAYLCPPSTEGTNYIYPDCSRRCSCINGQILCDVYECSPNASCKEGDNVSKCICNDGYIGDGTNCTIDTPPADCHDVYERVSNKSGVYKIKPTTWQGDPFDVYCNMTNGGGWTVFQRRVNGSQDFNLYWSDYKNGFGSAEHEFWLGNDNLHKLTSQKGYQLRIDLVDNLGDPYYATYSSFSINDEGDNYRLTVGSYRGNAGRDSMAYHNGQAFTTRDRDNDQWSGENCVNDNGSGACYTDSCRLRGGWWYKSCASASLNSPYGTYCLSWNGLGRNDCNLWYTEMKIRPN